MVHKNSLNGARSKCQNSLLTVGQEMTFLILVEMERERIDILDTFRRKIHSEPQVLQCYYITGEADFALIAMAKNMEQYQELIQRLFFNDTNVKRFRTSVVMDRTKVSLQVPVSPFRHIFDAGRKTIGVT